MPPTPLHQPVTSLTTEPSVVVHAASGRKLGYGEIAAFAKAPAQMPNLDAAKDLKPVNQFRILGKTTPRIDAQGRIAGRRIRFRAIHAIQGLERMPCLFHCYGRQPAGAV